MVRRVLKKNETFDAAEQSAADASLKYMSDEMPGMRRRKSGKGFAYFKVDGTRLTDARHLERIRALAIPPAYSDVWICPVSNGHLQATGRDARGRKQYRYHARWIALRDEAKFDRLAEFAGTLPAMRERINRDLRRHGLPKERVTASVVWLLENTMIRVGNHTYARENKSFGLTTLRSRHLQINGSRMRFKFRGKSGKEWNLQLADQRMVRVVRSIQELPGQHLFQYVDEDDVRRQIHSDDINAYIREISGSDFTSKMFRTWNGTLAAIAVLAETPLPESRSAANRVLNSAVDRVAELLGNTRAVCRKCYIHPRVVESWLAGRLETELATAKASYRKVRAGLDPAEMLALRWLEQTAGS